MGRREAYCIDEKTTTYRHKEHPTRCIRWTGLHLSQYGDQPVKQVLGSQVCDAGIAGISVAVESLPGGCVPTQEEREAGRERIRRAIEDIFACRCYWKDEDSAPNLDPVRQGQRKGEEAS